ncbi:phosphoethanolamine--lipid A transferase [Pseudomonas luteola]|uniref:phosphoethanolamine transferase n=1 Tax=Pseudomonas luteola TaxID=47886 RepID=UPI001EF45E91|nr:phosphoethanolamine--lipid A transferase [Pseudomonas luteola]MCG7371868.1 phosphoethanolamine--lipid A transferase [Pseudomonas luteola]
MLKLRPVRPEWLTLIVSAAFLIFYNVPLWTHLFDVVTPLDMKGVLTLGAVAVLFLAAFNLILTFFAFRWVFKPLLSVLFLSAAGVAYFMNQYGVLIDTEMLRNMLETDTAEVGDLLSFKLAAYLLLLGALPVWLLWRTPVQYRRWPRELLSKSIASGVTAVVMVGVAMLNYQSLSSLFRNHHEIHMQLTPSNSVGALISYVHDATAKPKGPLREIGTDAVRLAPVSAGAHKTLTVLVVGESARADNFGLDGYGRDTTPELRQEEGVISFTDMHSCGTETAVSVPCMFSNLTRAHYSDNVAKSQENLLDVLKRAGYDVIWRDNQAGCKETCNRVAFESLTKAQDPAFCSDGECHDEILLKDIQGIINHMQRDTVLVLHQMGSHGPAYFKRYPAAFEYFTPVCKNNELSQCSRESIVNGYDNTIRYTDHVLASLINTLRANQDKVSTAMFYLSDHGESLGEYNVFLHGMPYAVAPDQQKHIASVAWFSQPYQQSMGVNSQCVAVHRNDSLSQDNLFHSMLGLLRVHTQVYNAELDLFASCRQLSGATVASTSPSTQPPANKLN